MDTSQGMCFFYHHKFGATETITGIQGHFQSVLPRPQITLDNLALDLRSGKIRSEMPLAISAGFGCAFGATPHFW
ncbi:hypothetical protein J6590_005475 [Homalodisca vitripennis]|nr:hypothetical protein J6590_005475 [Homalodisca vitripennis]